MPRRDDDPIGFAAEFLAKLRFGRGRGLGVVARAGFLGPLLAQMVEMSQIGPEDNVLILGATEGLVPLAGPRCLRLTVADDLPDEELARLEEVHQGAKPRRIQFMRGKDGVLPSPQGTVDRILAFNWMYRARVPEAVMRGVSWVSHHGCRVLFCEPSVSLDARTARKYSREARLSMPDHQALVAYAGTALTHRRFTPEGLRGMFERAEMKDVQVQEMLHGLVLAVSGRCEF